MAPPPDGPVLQPQDSNYASDYNPNYSFAAADFENDDENDDYEISYSKNVITFVDPRQKSDSMPCADNAAGIGEKIKQKVKSILSKASTACSIYDFATDKIINLCTDDRSYRELALIPQKIGSNYIEATWEAGIVNTTRCNWIVLRAQSMDLAKQIADYSRQGAVSIRHVAGTGAVVSYAYYSSHVVPASSALAPHLLSASKCGALFVGTALLSLAIPYGIAKMQHQDAQFPLEFQTFSDHTSALVVNPRLLEPSIRHYKRKKILDPRRKPTLKPSVIDHFNCVKAGDFSFSVKPFSPPTLPSWPKMLPKQSARKNIKLPKSGLYDQSLFHDHCAVPTSCLGG